MRLEWKLALSVPTLLFQVADGRGNCTPHRNPTPCTIPQDKESIFHSIFAFFTKSGRRVSVNIKLPCCTVTFQRSLGVTPCEDSCFLFSQCSICLSHFPVTNFQIRSVFFLKGLWPAWKIVHDDLLQSGSTVKRWSFERRYKTSTEHRDSEDSKTHDAN